MNIRKQIDQLIAAVRADERERISRRLTAHLTRDLHNPFAKQHRITAPRTVHK